MTLSSIALVLVSCGGSSSPSAIAPPSGSPTASGSAPASAPPAPVNIDGPVIQGMVQSLFTELLPFMVWGTATAGGHVWEIPETPFTSALDGKPSLHTCGVFVTDQPKPTVIVSSQAFPDQSAGDYVSFAFDGRTMTGGGYHHASGEEWAWTSSAVDVGVVQVLDAWLVVWVRWTGDAGENFSAARGSAQGSATCMLAKPAEIEAFRAAVAAQDPLSWDSRVPAAPGAVSTRIVGNSPFAVEESEYPLGSYDEVVDHYRDVYGAPPRALPGIGPDVWGFEGSVNGAVRATVVIPLLGGGLAVKNFWTRP